MKKFTKVISTLLVVALVVAMATVSAFAAEAESITVISGPDKTVYYEGLDSYENEIWCDATGMVLEVTFSDSSTELITVDEYSYVDMYVVDYVIGENEAIVEFYGTDDYDTYLETTYTVTVEESPVDSVEVTKMPTKTEYDREDLFLSRQQRESKRLCEFILNQEPVLTEYSGMTGFFNCDSTVVGDAFRRMGHKAFEQMHDIFYLKAVDNLSTFEWQHATADYNLIIRKGIRKLIEEIEKLPKVKKVFIRSGIRFDYLMYDPDDSFFGQLVEHHVSGQLKVAPEHCSANALTMMGKPTVEVFEAFKRKFFELSREAGLEQYLVPYLMSSHPGSTLADALELALCLKRDHYAPEQVQDYYPTPGTASTVMFYTGINPLDMKPVYVATDYHEKQLQRALLQYNRPQNAPLVREALRKLGREDLIGYGSECLVRPERENAPKGKSTDYKDRAKSRGNKPTAKQGAARNEKSRGGKNARTGSANKQNHSKAKKKGSK